MTHSELYLIYYRIYLLKVCLQWMQGCKYIKEIALQRTKEKKKDFTQPKHIVEDDFPLSNGI